MSLFSGIFKHISLTSAVLPYNLNWIKKDWSIVSEFCDKNPITVFDVGARDGGVEELVGLEKMICYFGFDADKDECERLNKMSHPWHEYKCFPYFIGEKNETISFNLYKSPGQYESENAVPLPKK